MSVMIDVTHLSRSFGSIDAVRDISFTVERGEVLGFLGPNGAGKTTTMRMICGYLTPTQGMIKIGGINLDDDPMAVKRQIGYLPEGAPSYPEMRVVDFLDFAAQIRGLKGAHKKRRLMAVVDQVQIEGVMYQKIDTLSKGFRRRVGLAQAILHDPDVLILDEPTDGLDPNQKHDMRLLIAQMAAEKAILISTHILEEVDAVCSRAMIIAQGEIVADGTPRQLREMSRFYNAVQVRLHKKSVSIFQDQARGLDGVASVEIIAQGKDVAELMIFPKKSKSIVNQLQPLMRDQQFMVEEVRVDGGRLDEVFRTLTDTDKKAG